MGIAVIYQDHHLLVVNKPAGLVIHPTYKHADGTMWDEILAYLSEQGDDDWQPPDLPDEPGWARAPEHVRVMLRERRTEKLWKEEGLLPRPRLLHRLDKDTSGLVVLARTLRACRHLVQQFNEHTIVKRYLALVREGAPEWANPRALFIAIRRKENGRESQEQTPADLSSLGNDELVLDGPLQRDPVDRRRCIVGPAGQSAVTVVRVLAAERGFALLEARPVTGRTHQIRAHLAALGYAIVGDRMYGLPTESGTPEAALGRQFLHAYSIELRRYPDHALCRFVAPLAGDLSTWLERYGPSLLATVRRLIVLGVAYAGAVPA